MWILVSLLTVIDFSDIDKLCPSRNGRAFGIGQHHRQVDFYQTAITDFIQSTSMYHVHVCEIGLNCGHSTITFLKSHPGVSVLNFDLPTQHYSGSVREFMKTKYSGRVSIVDGDSLVEVPRYFKKHPKETCDILVIDGRHNFRNALQDALNLMRHASNTSIIIMDDVCNIKNCTSHYPDGSNHPYVIGPTQAWNKLLSSGYVTKLKAGEAHDRGWVLGKINTENLLWHPQNVDFHKSKHTTHEADYIHDGKKSALRHIFMV